MRHGGSRFPDNVTPGDRDRLHRGDSGTTPGDWHSEGGERAGDRVMVDEPTSVKNTTYVIQKNGFFFKSAAYNRYRPENKISKLQDTAHKSLIDGLDCMDVHLSFV